MFLRAAVYESMMSITKIMYTTYILGVNIHIMTSAATKSSVKRLCRSRTQYVLWNQKKVTAFSTICQIQKADLIYVLRLYKALKYTNSSAKLTEKSTS